MTTDENTGRLVWVSQAQRDDLHHGQPDELDQAGEEVAAAFDAAPSDPVEAVAGIAKTAMLTVLPDPTVAFDCAETLTHAVLVALGANEPAHLRTRIGIFAEDFCSCGYAGWPCPAPDDSPKV